MPVKIPILLSFYALSNGDTTLLFGQVTYTGFSDLSFRDYNRRKTFRTLFKLYRTKSYANQDIILILSGSNIPATTNRHGAFYVKTLENIREGVLEKVLLATGEEVKMIDGLYLKTVNHVQGDHIIISDLDDTLMHSFIYRKLHKFRTLMFTTVEKRKAVVHMQELMASFITKGDIPIYLSNSEQNLYPLIYRFLIHNGFPPGPLFLKQMRKLLDVIMNIKFPPNNTHKISTLEELLALFPKKQFILMGDNTQHDLSIYLSAVEKFGNSIRYIIIRKVIEKKADEVLIEKSQEILKANNISLHYSDDFPKSFEL